MAVIVMFVPEAENERMPPAVKVTSVPELEFKVTGEEVPEKVRSVTPVAVEAMVTIPSRPVPEVVSVIPEPSTNLKDPPEFERVKVWLVASEVEAKVWSSFVTDPSTSVAVTVTAPPVWLITAMPAPVIDHEPPPLERVFV